MNLASKRSQVRFPRAMSRPEKGREKREGKWVAFAIARHDMIGKDNQIVCRSDRHLLNLESCCKTWQKENKRKQNSSPAPTRPNSRPNQEERENERLREKNKKESKKETKFVLHFSCSSLSANTILTQPKAKTRPNKKKSKEKARRKEEERRKKEDEGKASNSTFKISIKHKSIMCIMPFLR